MIYRLHYTCQAGHHTYADYKTKRTALKRLYDDSFFDGWIPFKIEVLKSVNWQRINGMWMQDIIKASADINRPIIKIIHNNKIMQSGHGFVNASEVKINGYNVLRRHYTDCHSVDSVLYWCDIVNDNIPNNAELMNPYDSESGWLSFGSFKDCYNYIIG